MNIDIQTDGFPLTRAIEAYVTRRLRFSLSTRADSIGRIRVHLSHVDGRGGECDRRCLLRVELPGHADVTIENTEPDLYVAIHRAVDRAGWSVKRRLDRRLRQVRARLLPARGTAPRAQTSSPSY